MTDDLLKQIRETREMQDKIDLGRAKTKSESRVERMSEDVTMFHRFVLQLITALQWSFVNVGIPLWKIIRWPFWRLLNGYRRVWSLIVYRRDEFDNLRFSKVRAGTFLTATFVFLWFMLMPTLVFVGEVISYAVTADVDEVVFLHNSQEINPDENMHSVQGATKLPLDEDDSFYFRVESTLFNHLWSITHRGNLFYADYVAAAIPPGVNRCVITSYGFRLKTLMRNWEIYPHLLSASCQPVSGKEIE